MSNTQNEQAKINTSFEENYIDENIKMDTDGKVKAFIKKFMKRKTAKMLKEVTKISDRIQRENRFKEKNKS